MADKGLSKMDGVRRALAELGREATPQQIKDYLKSKFNIEMTKEYISKYKSSILQQQKAKRAKAKKAPAPESAVAVASVKPAPAPAPVPTNRTGVIGLDDIQIAKVLVGRVGAEQLLTLIELLAK
jgi:hypothetical protein